MSNHNHRVPSIMRILTFILMVLIGYLFAVSHLTAGTSPAARQGVDLPTLTKNKAAAVEALQTDVEQAKAEVAKLTKIEHQSGNPPMKQPYGYRGPGITIALSDAPITGDLPEGATADDLVIHQGDIEAVFNALWAGGADYVAIGGVEVRPNTLVRCVGNVINVNGKLHSPPFVVSAIGDPPRLLKALEKDEAITIFQQYVNRYHLGFQVQESSDIVITRVKTLTDYKFVKVLEDGTSSR